MRTWNFSPAKTGSKWGGTKFVVAKVSGIPLDLDGASVELVVLGHQGEIKWRLSNESNQLSVVGDQVIINPTLMTLTPNFYSYKLQAILPGSINVLTLLKGLLEVTA